MVQATNYLHGTSRGEQERLRSQPTILEQEARSLLDRLGIQSGWREHLDAPTTTVFFALLVQAWGRRPS
jgi:hypothetical protein